MADTLDAALDAAMPAAIEAATPKGDKAETTTGTTEKTAAPSATAAVDGHTSTAPKPTSKTGEPTTQAGGDDGEPQDTDWQKIPSERQTRILENARKKQAAETETAIREEYGFTKDEWAKVRDDFHALISDPEKYIQRGYAILKATGRITDAAPPPAPTRPSERPTPSLHAEDGTPTYSASDVEALLTRELTALRDELKGGMKPFEEFQHERRLEQIHDRADKVAKATIADAETWEGWNDLRPKVAAMMQKDGRHTVSSAYARLLPEYLKERDKTRDSETRQKVLAELKAQPKGPERSVTPSAAQVGQRGNRRGHSDMDAKMDAELARLGY